MYIYIYIYVYVYPVNLGRAASGGALAPEPTRATRIQPESIHNFQKKIVSIFKKIVFFSKSDTGCVNHRLTRTWFVPLSLVCTWFVPLPLCDHSQGVYLPPNRRRSKVFRILFQQTNKQTNKQTRGRGSGVDILTVDTHSSRFQFQSIFGFDLYQ